MRDRFLFAPGDEWKILFQMYAGDAAIGVVYDHVHEKHSGRYTRCDHGEAPRALVAEVRKWSRRAA